jgi:hypothetical protein
LEDNSLGFRTGNYFEQTGNGERENARNKEIGAISFMLCKSAHAQKNAFSRDVIEGMVKGDLNSAASSLLAQLRVDQRGVSAGWIERGTTSDRAPHGMLSLGVQLAEGGFRCPTRGLNFWMRLG